MREKIAYIIIFFALVISSNKTFAQFIPVEDPAFAKFLCDSFPQVMSTDCLQLDTVKAKLETEKMDAKDLQITSINELKYFENLSWISFDENNISTIPDLSFFPNLTFINFNGNKLTDTLDFSKYTNLEFIIINRNPTIKAIRGIEQLVNLKELQLLNCNLTEIPNILNLPLLTTLYLRYNRLTFSDLDTITKHTNFSSSFSLFPQYTVNENDTIITLTEGQTLQINYPYDNDVDFVNYTWYHNDTQIAFATENILTIENITTENAGEYYIVVKSNKAEFINDSIYSKSFIVNVSKQKSPCLQELDILMGVQEFCDSIVLEVEILNTDTLSFTYYLENKFNNKQTEFNSQDTLSITSGRYSLIANYNNQCTITLVDNATFSYKDDCTKYFTPNKDGDNDNWYIEFAGESFIRNSQGQVIKTINGPAFWDGTTESGELASDGIYLIESPKGIQTKITLFR